jgi:hypothetical protein
MTKMAPIIGQKSTIENFLQHFSELCGDTQLYVRKVCATNFGDFAAAVGQQKTEEVLVGSKAQFITYCLTSDALTNPLCCSLQDFWRYVEMQSGLCARPAQKYSPPCPTLYQWCADGPP